MENDDESTGEARRRRADESLATGFTRIMRAASSRWGVLTDPPVVCAFEAVLVVGSVLLYNIGVLEPGALPIVYALLAIPLLVAVAVDLSLRGARREIVAWLASVPFPIENMNGLLNGVAQNLLVRFEATPPPRAILNAELEKVHTDCFALEYDDDEPEVEVRIGVLDSKINPASVNHRRYLRVQTLVEQALLPLSEKHPIELVRIC
jgi:hypothetical protein